MTDLNTLFSLMLIFVFGPIGIIGGLILLFIRKNDRLRNSVSEIAKEKGKDALAKGIEWVFRKK